MNYIIYKTINKTNQMFYIGQHQTKNLNDRYAGSGTTLRKAIRAEGIKNFETKILFNFNTFNEMNDKEIELVTQKEIDNPMCYNIKLGGQGQINKCMTFKKYWNLLITKDLKSLYPIIKKNKISDILRYFNNKINFDIKWNNISYTKLDLMFYELCEQVELYYKLPSYYFTLDDDEKVLFDPKEIKKRQLKKEEKLEKEAKVFKKEYNRYCREIKAYPNTISVVELNSLIKNYICANNIKDVSQLNFEEIEKQIQSGYNIGAIESIFEAMLK